MSVHEDAQMLIAFSSEYVEYAIGGSTSAGTAVSQAIQRLQKVREINADTITRSIVTLGAEQAGVGTIAASASVVGSKVDELEGLMEATLSALTNLDQTIIRHSSVIAGVGQALLRGGS